MADQDKHEPGEGAVATALVKVLGIALVIGAVVAGGIFLAVRSLGLGAGNDSAASDLPDPASSSSPLPTVALTPSGSAGTSPSASPSEDDSASESPSPDGKLTLSAAQAQVASGQRIDLTGRYAGQNGTVLQVQRKSGGSWGPFSDVTARVQGGGFSTYVITSRGGKQRFRVFDDDAGLGSNPVVVTVG